MRRLADLRVGEHAEWGVTVEAALVRAAAATAPGLPEDEVPIGVLAGLASAVLRRHLPGPGSRVEALTVHLSGRLVVGETVWARATVAATDAEKGLATLALAFTNQRGEGVARGTAVVRPPPPLGLDVRPR